MSRLDLMVIPTGKAKVVILAESEYGEATIEIEDQIINDLERQSRNLRRSYAGAIRNRQGNLEVEMPAFGTTLFNSFIKDDVLSLFNRSVGGSVDGKLTIRLLLGQPSLNRVHWELMRYQNEYVGFRHNVIRHPFVSKPVSSSNAGRKKVRVLVVGVDPINGPSTIDEEHSCLVKLFEALEDQVELMTLYQKEATLGNVIDCMFSGVDVFHFSGHAFYNDNNPADSYLVVFGNEQDSQGELSVRTISTLATSQNLGFRFLNACSTGRTASNIPEGQLGEHFVSIAHSVIEAGVPMVLATNHDISVPAATKLSRRFYTSILKFGRRVDEAVRDGRSELFMGEQVFESDWSCPVLYARSPNLALGFEPVPWEESLDLYRVRRVRRPDDVISDSVALRPK